MFAVLHFPQFALQAALRHEPELWLKPLALVDPALPTPRVCDRTPSAHALGVTDGLTPTQALARCRELIVRHRSPTQEAAATDAILQCAYNFSPNIENTLPGTATLDLRGLSELRSRRREENEESKEKNQSGSADRQVLDCASPLALSTELAGQKRQRTAALQDAPATKGTPFSSYRAWADRLRLALLSLNLQARIGIGPTPNVARHAAWWAAVSTLQPVNASTPLPDGIEIVLDSPPFIAALPVAALEPSDDVALILHKWGIRTVGELLSLGQDAVVERLGLEALALFAAASTTAIRPLNLARPLEHFEESFDFEHEIETMEPLLFILRRFVDYLAQRLELAGLAAELLALRLRLESGEVLERRLRVPQPTRRADILFRMLRTHLETLRANSPIVSVALKADPAQPEQKQFSLFEAALRDPHQFQETLARLSALVGSDRLGTPVRENSHRPDAFKLVPPDFENAPSGLEQRVPEILRVVPARRLRPAVKAKVECAKLKAQGSKEGPISTSRKSNGNIVELLGPLFSSDVKNQPGAPKNNVDASFPLSPSLSPNEEGARKAGEEERRALSADAFSSSTPLSIRCKVANGKLSVALGPWRVSGRWWEATAWEREEWDVATRDGQALRLVNEAGQWRVEAVVD
jgi:protein ImuB